jgi:hypothetical protein
LAELAALAQLAAAITAEGCCAGVARAAPGAVNVRASLCHADQRFIFDEIKLFLIHLQELNVLGLRGAASRAGFDGAGVLSAAGRAFPN